MIQTIAGPASLSTPPDVTGLSVLSYNVLLPNSVDGWWNYKMYSPPLGQDKAFISDWEYRRDLLKERISTVDADVVCFQEVSPVSFEDDFAFMEELGYTGKEMFKKGRFRPATFWKGCELAAPAVHKDRTLLTAFRRNEKTWYVLNCHLQAGAEARRRVRQIHEGTKAVLTLARKLKEPEPETSVPLVVCGDFNGGSECAAVRFLEDGAVDETFLEDGEPAVSSKKALPLAEPLRDVYVERGCTPPPPTLVVAELISSMVKGEGAFEKPNFTDDVVATLKRVFERYASQQLDDGSSAMNVDDVEKWLVDINGKVGRGSEFREAARQMGWEESKDEASKDQRIELPRGGTLNMDGFIAVYESELRGGKFWGIAHDLAVMGEPLPDVGLFQGRYDRMYCSMALKPSTVMTFTADKPCPNDSEPSDHLPVAASFVVSPESTQV